MREADRETDVALEAEIGAPAPHNSTVGSSPALLCESIVLGT